MLLVFTTKWNFTKVRPESAPLIMDVGAQALVPPIM